MPLSSLTRLSATVVPLTFILAVLGAACSVASIPGMSDAPSTGVAPASSVVCGGAEYEKEDVSKLSACECKAGGKAHCVAKSKIPDSVEPVLNECDGAAGMCIPDTLLEGKAPTTCETSGGEGRCLSLCVKKVGELAEALDRGKGDVCPADERCVPCINPTNNQPTGICDLGRKPAAGECQTAPPATTDEGAPVSCPFNGTPKDVSPYPVCAPGGRCVKTSFIDTTLTDPAKRDELKKRLNKCEGETGLCVPEEYIREYTQHLPTSCTSFAGIEGRCFSTVFKDIDAHKELLQRDRCAAEERCIPCFNPATGEPTGACTTVSCDQPKTTTKPSLKDCCRKGGKTQGKCVPKTDVPSQFQSRLNDFECDNQTELCVPAENLDPNTTPITCATSVGGHRGVCVSDCIEFRLIEAIVLGRSSCPEQHTCVPCVDPKSGAPTGAPGCN